MFFGDKKKLSPLWREGETIDELFNGRLTIFQKERGYRFSIDAVLLADFVRLKKNSAAVEFGMGSGIVSLMLACRYDSARIVGVEIQEALAEMAERSVRLNGLEGRVAVRLGDVRDVGELLAERSFDVAVFNPPYRKLNSGKINPSREKAIARHEVAGSLALFLQAACHAVKEFGSVYAIYPAVRGVELISRMRENCIEPKRIQMVHSNRFSRAELILVEGVRLGGEEMEVLPPLFIYEGKGKYTGAIQNIFTFFACLPAVSFQEDFSS